MAKKSCKQIALAQNFLRSSKLVRSLLDTSSIASSDVVYEIGSGRGIITAELARVASKVVAIEKDPVLVQKLRERFQDVNNVEITEKDFLKYRIPKGEYKIFANIPYNITADILRKILHEPPAPSEAYLVMQKEAAEKFSGNPRETQFSILAKPLFDIQIIRELRRTDFEPVPNVDSVLLHIKKRRSALVSEKDTFLYRSFVRYGFSRWKNSLKLIFKPIFTYGQWKHVSKDLHFPVEATPTKLTFEQWLGLFECFKQRVPGDKQAYVKR
ncbi:MAG: 23S ribosomal RNA methyltransferase Erm [Anaerolineae bacterium]|nr:23S ribosomal RNA methyltransferase Erm [Anaerolineae bacterium]MCI0608593.1 23S ribosomal RNA methyltransferase Erm [Anaerolineae bacterium]